HYIFLDRIVLSFLHVFPYSERDNTLAVSMSDSVPWEERTRRARRLNNLSEKKRRYFHEQHLGLYGHVLVERPRESVGEDFLYGYTENYIPVRMPYAAELVECVVKVCLQHVLPDMTVEGILLGSDG
ncbi:MAG: tRNA (N(6)-L-threonylcarbamoyladenosine(37)-C(2))-methylthiotransferase MtaB, partial [Cytophagales bacterium]|nr:tRNA (N(6)-L-threonylcarbamoyladenosine(37)-C(2))-methylthiotransferase MtaB [Cytophagales bacterium]